jgi:hypothetical protein
MQLIYTGMMEITVVKPTLTGYITLCPRLDLQHVQTVRDGRSQVDQRGVYSMWPRLGAVGESHPLPAMPLCTLSAGFAGHPAPSTCIASIACRCLSARASPRLCDTTISVSRNPPVPPPARTALRPMLTYSSTRGMHAAAAPTVPSAWP